MNMYDCVHAFSYVQCLPDDLVCIFVFCKRVSHYSRFNQFTPYIWINLISRFGQLAPRMEKLQLFTMFIVHVKMLVGGQLCSIRECCWIVPKTFKKCPGLGPAAFAMADATDVASAVVLTNASRNWASKKSVAVFWQGRQSLINDHHHSDKSKRVKYIRKLICIIDDVLDFSRSNRQKLPKLKLVSFDTLQLIRIYIIYYTTDISLNAP